MAKYMLRSQSAEHVTAKLQTYLQSLRQRNAAEMGVPFHLFSSGHHRKMVTNCGALSQRSDILAPQGSASLTDWASALVAGPGRVTSHP